MTICFLLILFQAFYVYSSLNDRPIVGVLAQEQTGKLREYGTSYISASPVKFLESAGARVVPIWVNQTKNYYKDMFNSINGVLYPGGDVSIEDSGYGRAGKILYDLAVEANRNGDFFPIWGTCLGFELLNFLAVGRNWMAACKVQDVALPLEVTPDAEKSRMFTNISTRLLNILKTHRIAINYHDWCFTPTNYSRSSLDKFFRVLTVNNYDNTTFVSTIEAVEYPFYGTAWHPEMSPFEFVYNSEHHSIPHSPEAILVSQYFANFFVDETRKNFHQFPSKEIEAKALIYNYQPINTGINGSTFQQCYFFGK